jgi:Tol biopolymer transport system component
LGGCVLRAASADPQPVWKGLGATHLGQPSADGRFVTGIHPDSGELLVHDLSSGLQRRIGRKKQSYEFAYFSTIAPDSKRAAYAWYNEERFYELRVASVDTGEERTVFRNDEAGFVQPCAFSPDGKQVLTLLFRKDNISQIALIPAEGGPPRILKSLNWVYPKRMDWSPDGKRIVYDNFAREGAAQRDIFLLTADGSREERLVESPGDDVFPVFSRDGKRVFFSTDRSGEAELWSLDLETRTPAVLRKGIGRALIMGVTNEGRLFYSTRTGGSTIYSARIDPATGRIVSRPEPVGEGTSAAWSPDGKQIAWLARQSAENFGSEARFVAIRDTEAGTPARSIAPKLAHIEALSWNGSAKLVLSGSDAKGRGGVFEVALPDGSVTALVSEPGAPHQGFPARGPYYAKDREVFRFGQSEPVLKFPARVTAIAVYNSETVAVATGTTVTVVGPKGRFETRAPSQPVTAMEWSADGKNLLLVQKDELWWTGWGLILMDRVAKTAAPIESISLHPSGSEILFSAGRSRSEVWAVEVDSR